MKKPFRAGLLMIFSFFLTAATAQEAEWGKASFYDDSFQGSLTAYGVKYDKNQLTASHKLHPFGTILKVTRLDNKKSVNVKVIDKGPYLKGRVVDLSRKAAEALDMIEEGVVDVKVEVVSKAKSSDLAKAEEKKATVAPPATEIRPESYSDESTRTTPPTKVSNISEAAEKTTAVSTTTTKADTPKKATTAAKQSNAAKLVGKDYAAYDLYQIQLLRPTKKGFGVQIASLTTYEYVLRQVADLQAKSFDNILISVEKGKDNNPVYKIILGNYDTEAQANNYKKNLKSKYKINGFVVDLSATKY